MGFLFCFYSLIFVSGLLDVFVVVNIWCFKKTEHSFMSLCGVVCYYCFSPGPISCLLLIGAEQRLDFNYSEKNLDRVRKKLRKDSFRSEDGVHRRDWDDPLEEGMAAHSSILAWRITWTEEPGGLQSMGLQRIRHD